MVRVGSLRESSVPENLFKNDQSTSNFLMMLDIAPPVICRNIPDADLCCPRPRLITPSLITLVMNIPGFFSGPGGVRSLVPRYDQDRDDMRDQGRASNGISILTLNTADFIW